MKTTTIFKTAKNNIDLMLAYMGASTVLDETIIVQSIGWEYEMNNDGSVDLLKYVGTDNEMVLPDFYMIDGTNYLVRLNEGGNLVIPKTVTHISNKDIAAINHSVTPIVEKGNMNYEAIGGVLVRKRYTDEDFIFAYSVLDEEKHTISIDGFSSAGMANEDFDKIDLVIAPKYIINDISYTVVKIGDSAFTTDTTGSDYWEANGDIETVVLPKTVTEIGTSAFLVLKKQDNVIAHTSLKRITGLDNVNTVGAYAFKNIPYITELYMPNLVNIGDKAFIQLANLREITLSDELKVIPLGCFQSCFKLVSVKGDFTLTDIGQKAFMYCYNLKELKITDALTSVGIRAFDKCKFDYDWSQLTSCTFGENATKFQRFGDIINENYDLTPCNHYEHKVIAYAQSYRDWREYAFGNGYTMGLNGCTWCALTAAYNAMNNTNYNPKEMNDLVRSVNDILANEKVYANTTYLNIKISEDISVDSATNINRIYTELSQGNLIGLCGDGHITLCYGINENGEIMVADSSPVEGMVTGNSLYSEYYECDLFNLIKSGYGYRIFSKDVPSAQSEEKSEEE